MGSWGLILYQPHLVVQYLPILMRENEFRIRLHAAQCHLNVGSATLLAYCVWSASILHPALCSTLRILSIADRCHPPIDSGPHPHDKDHIDCRLRGSGLQVRQCCLSIPHCFYIYTHIYIYYITDFAPQIKPKLGPRPRAYPPTRALGSRSTVRSRNGRPLAPNTRIRQSGLHPSELASSRANHPSRSMINHADIRIYPRCGVVAIVIALPALTFLWNVVSSCVSAAPRNIACSKRVSTSEALAFLSCFRCTRRSCALYIYEAQRFDEDCETNRRVERNISKDRKNEPAIILLTLMISSSLDIYFGNSHLDMQPTMLEGAQSSPRGPRGPRGTAIIPCVAFFQDFLSDTERYTFLLYCYRHILRSHPSPLRLDFE
ncbi:hypothetical protein BJ875DRAFT_191650 [Amylocarpus encephaloides]|uniref:Uncharacterized protein n=1 Tax=Amylocarpus encephaloides TaxID=45428 RepID=A0A9P8C7R1_9HELO|nr:hypothetical protein BJ875DRAFT_191650 [Amylocarpus encephaloides]